MTMTNKIKRYLIEIENTSPLKMGNGKEGIEGITQWENRAVIHGTSIAGVFRDFLMKNKKSADRIDLIFPEYKDSKEKNKRISPLYFYDTYSNEQLNDKDFICRPHIKINRKRGTVEDKQLLREYHIKEGQKFKLILELKGIHLKDDEYNVIDQSVKEFINALGAGNILLGSHTTFGFGAFRGEQYFEKEYYLFNEKDLNEYLEEYLDEDSTLYEKLSQGSGSGIKIKKEDTDKITIRFKAKCKDGLMIKGKEEKEGYKTSYQEEKGFIIPSSTIKGIVRSYSEKIYETLGKCVDELDDVYGVMLKDPDQELKSKIEAKKGKLIFSDCKINYDEKKGLAVYNRIAIDRFTGGVKDGSVFSEKVVIPNEALEFRVTMHENAKKAIPLLILTFRDMGFGYLTIGSGNNVGYGRLRGESIEIEEPHGKIYKVDFKDGVLEGQTEKFQEYIKLLHEK
jgi:CRISPR/Cas system CMR subunit Cmr4 (Cas7 group RAMP superfamily)